MPLQRRYSLDEASSEIFTPHCTPPSIWSGVNVGLPGPRTVMGCEPEEKGTGIEESQQMEKILNNSRVSLADPLDEDMTGTERVDTPMSDPVPAHLAASTSPLGYETDSMEVCSNCDTASIDTDAASSTVPSSPSSIDCAVQVPPEEADDEHPSFLTLPLEIRHQIYLYLPDTLILHRPLIYGITPFSGRKVHYLAGICRQIRQEAMSLIYGQNEWVVSLEFKIMYEAFRRWVLEEVGESAGYLRKLRVGVRCEGLSPKVKRRIVKPSLLAAIPPPPPPPPPPPNQTQTHHGVAISIPNAIESGEMDMDLDGATGMAAMAQSSRPTHSLTANPTSDILEDVDTDASDSTADSPNANQSEASISTNLTPPSSPPEPEPDYEVVAIRSDGDATFVVDLSEKHHGGLVTVLRSEALPEDTENVRLMLESVVNWLWQKRRLGTMTGVDLVEGMDRFLESVGVRYR